MIRSAAPITRFAPRIAQISLLAWMALPSASVLADNAELNEMVEQNAASAAHARLCNEDPMTEQLKATTMLVLALSGVASENVQLGSAKFTDVMRKEMHAKRKVKDFSCREHLAVAEDRLLRARVLSRQLREGTVPAK